MAAINNINPFSKPENPQNCHLSISSMKKFFNSHILGNFKLMLAGAALTLSFVSIDADGVFAHHTSSNSRNNRIAQKVRQLKTTSRRWIQVDLSRQRLIAWQGKTPVFAYIVSTGKKKTPTITGIFNVQTKLRKTRMRGEDYDVPNVPHTMYYYGGYAIHGAYWHNRFGTPVSHGCVNMRPSHAKRLFNWASVGTPVIVQR